MSSESVTIHGIVLADGSLQLIGNVPLLPGPVEVVVRPLGPPKAGELGSAILARIHAEQVARGYVPRSAEEVEAAFRQYQEEWDERDREIEAIHNLRPRGDSPS